MSRASWSKLGGGKLRRELELARELGWDWGRATGFRPQEGARRVVGLRLNVEAGACGAAGRAAA